MGNVANPPDEMQVGSLPLVFSEAVIEALARKVAEYVKGAERPQERPRYLDVDGALNWLGWGRQGRSKLYNLTSAGAIPHRKHGGKLFFVPDELDSYMDSHKRGRAA
jgi:hypothetical protein